VASIPPAKTRDENAIVERAVRRLHGQRDADPAIRENAAEFVTYLVRSGIHDEDELVELASIANGKRYDPQNGSFL
jgi:hypothetical protein